LWATTFSFRELNEKSQPPPPSAPLQSGPHIAKKIINDWDNFQYLQCAPSWTLRCLTPGEPTVLPILPPRENTCFPDPFPVRLQLSRKN